MTIIFGDKVNKKYLHQCIEMDYESYRDDQHLDYELVEAFMLKNPYIYIMCIDEKMDKVMGYVNLAPINKQTYDRLKNGDMLDSQIMPKDVLVYEDNTKYLCYFYSIVVSEKFRRRGIANTLIENLKKFIMELKNKRNIIITNIVADVLSDGGKKIVEKMGMKYVHNSKHDSEIYEYSVKN